MVSYGTSKESFAGAWGTIEEDSLRLRDTQAIEDLRVLDWKLYHFLHFLDLLIETTDHVVGRVWDFLDLHQVNQGVYL